MSKYKRGTKILREREKRIGKEKKARTLIYKKIFIGWTEDPFLPDNWVLHLFSLYLILSYQVVNILPIFLTNSLYWPLWAISWSFLGLRSVCILAFTYSKLVVSWVLFLGELQTSLEISFKTLLVITEWVRVCLKSAYFVEIEKILLKML